MKKKLPFIIIAVLLLTVIGLRVFTDVLEKAVFVRTAWSLLPPAVAIVLALITREVYSSLFVGMLAGALLLNRFEFMGSLESLLTDGFIGSVGDTGNAGILIFLVILGIFVVLLGRSGAAGAYGRWAEQHIKSRRLAMVSTFLLGVFLSVDDYFNTMTVGNVMRPITDRNKISRAKLAYIIDATAAPMCMIMPISSWSAAVSSNINSESGITLFVQAIPFNFYSLLTLFMVFFLAMLQFDFGPMGVHEANAKKGDLFTVKERIMEDEFPVSERAKVVDLFLPVLFLIAACVTGLLYSGGFFAGKGVIEALSDCTASLGLSMGALAALLFTILYFQLRGLLSFKEEVKEITQGFMSMVPALLILIFAWSLSGLTLKLGAREFVGDLFAGGTGSLGIFLPALVFLVSVGLAFATGSSWGTMSIVLPMVDGIGLTGVAFVMTVSACLAGAVCGDHCSPISDTNILSSAAAHCDHIAHVTTQLPYAAIVLSISFIGYVLAGLTESAAICLPVVFALEIAVILLIRARVKRTE